MLKIICQDGLWSNWNAIFVALSFNGRLETFGLKRNWGNRYFFAPYRAVRSFSINLEEDFGKSSVRFTPKAPSLFIVRFYCKPSRMELYPKAEDFLIEHEFKPEEWAPGLWIGMENIDMVIQSVDLQNRKITLILSPRIGRCQACRCRCLDSNFKKIIQRIFRL